MHLLRAGNVTAADRLAPCGVTVRFSKWGRFRRKTERVRAHLLGHEKAGAARVVTEGLSGRPRSRGLQPA